MTDVDTVERVKAAIRKATPYHMADALVERSARAAIAALPPAVHYCPNCGNAHRRGVDRFCDKCLHDEPTTPDPVAEAAKEGPQPLTTAYSCKGCKWLKTEWWKDYLENDETDSGTHGTCLKAGKSLGAYWSVRTAVPDWCPCPLTKDGEDG